MKIRKEKIIALALSVVIALGVTVGANYKSENSIYDKEFLNYSGDIITPTGDFIQPWMCEDWEVSDYEAHLDLLAEAGYDTVLWQYSVVAYNSEASTYYPAENLDSYYSTIYTDKTYMTERLLTAAENKGFKVFMGLSNDDDWWSVKAVYNSDWHLKKAEKDNVIASQLYSLYKERFPNAFYGWYWSWETWVNPIGLEKNWARMLNVTLEYLTELDSSMPLLFSPFISKYLRLSEGATNRMWTRFFKVVNFREGDIFAPQDSIGKISNAEIEKDALVSTFRFLRGCYEAAQVNSNVHFWVNCELFASESFLTKEGEFDTATIERIEMQLKTASHYAEGIITFSYSHFCVPEAPNGNAQDQASFHQAYVDMINN